MPSALAATVSGVPLRTFAHSRSISSAVSFRFAPLPAIADTFIYSIPRPRSRGKSLVSDPGYSGW
jgi:hypothetical protein